jgi:hypothetical protein
VKRFGGPVVHLTLFAVASALALYTMMRPEDGPQTGRAVAAELWGGSPNELRQIRFDSTELKVWIAPKSDVAGRYYVVNTERIAKAEPDPNAAVSAQKPSAAKQFLSVDEATELAAALVPMKTYRSLGRVDGARMVEFGFDKPAGTLVVDVGGREHKVLVGSLTPGSDEYYIRDEATSQAYTFTAEQINRLKSADSRLMERDLHGFKVDEIAEVRVAVGTKTRALTRLESKADAWADKASPTTLDETAGNFLAKLARLRPQVYLEQVAELSAPLFLVTYLDKKGKKLGQLELYRAGVGPDKKYFARTERTRWYSEVGRPAAEQLEQDVSAVVK